MSAACRHATRIGLVGSRPLAAVLARGPLPSGRLALPAQRRALPRREAPRPWGLCPRTNRGAGQAPGFRAYPGFWFSGFVSPF